MRKTLYAVLVLGCCALLFIGCEKKDDTPTVVGNALVQLNVGSRAVEETDGGLTTEESTLHSLRVYAFVGEQKAGYYETKEGLDQSTPFFMHLKMFTRETQKVTFYVVANEEAMTQTAGSGAQLTEGMSKEQLDNFSFTGLDLTSNLAKGLPMFAKFDEDLNMSETEKVSEEGDHNGHDKVAKTVTVRLQRPMAKLGVFAAKQEGEGGTLKIKGLTMLKSGTCDRNYLMPQDDLKGISQADGDIVLAVDGEGLVTKELNEQSVRTNPALYTPVLGEPFYPFENPWGNNGGDWSTPGPEGRGGVLRVDYEFDGKDGSGLVYMPVIERNTYYAVCCLIHKTGDIAVDYWVADWDTGADWKFDFDYPQYDNPLTPISGQITDPSLWGKPTVYYPGENPVDPDEGAFAVHFKISGPQGQMWKPVLLGDFAQATNFKVEVWDGDTQLTDEKKWVANTNKTYTIKVKATDNDYQVNGKTKTVGLAISYEPMWAPGESSMLLINGKTDRIAWPDSGTVPEVIEITQINPNGAGN
ncbi:MAG: hypothetical protein KH111_07015 [Bacteroidales bacterium]|nr:hypothetical protein [Bacteroidales bacterium]